MDNFKTADVFTPTKPAEATFVERDSLTNQLVESILTPGKQIVVYGHSGSGKTTLLRNKLNQTCEEWIKTSCTSDTTVDSLILDAFDQLGSVYISESTDSKEKSLVSSVKASYLSIKTEISGANTTTQSSTTRRVVPTQLTVQRLASFLGAAGFVWVIEDFHKVGPEEKTRLAQVMKVFMDAAADYSAVKIVAIGAVDTAREVVACEPEMLNRVAEIHVPLMSSDEIKLIIAKGEDCLRCSFDAGLKQSIADFSNGLAAVCHQLCLNACFAADILITCDETVAITQKHLKESIERYLSNSSDSLKATFELATRRKKAGKFDNCRLIIEALSKLGSDGGTHNEILRQIQRTHSDYPAGNVTLYLKELQTSDRGEMLRCNSASGRFSFSNPFYRAYAKLLFDKSPAPPTKINLKFEYGRDIEFAIEYYASTLKQLSDLKLPMQYRPEGGGSENP